MSSPLTPLSPQNNPAEPPPKPIFLPFQDLVEEAVNNNIPKPIGIEKLTQATLTLMLRKDLSVILVTGQIGSGKTSLMHGVAHAISQLEHIKNTTAFLEWDINDCNDSEEELHPMTHLKKETENLCKRLASCVNKNNIIVLLDTPLPSGVNYQQFFDTLGTNNFFNFEKTTLILPIDPDNQPILLKLLETQYQYKTGIVDLTKPEHRIFPPEILRQILMLRKEKYTDEAISSVIEAVVKRRRAVLQIPQPGIALSPTLHSDIANLNTIMETASTVSEIQQHTEVTKEDVQEALAQLTLSGNLVCPPPPPSYFL